ncbi:MAG: PaaI family thioesterase [Acetobacteraceae bacterium]
MTEYDPAADGWNPVDNDQMPSNIGTPWRRRVGDAWQYGLQTRPDHANPAGAVHGGILVAFADHCLGCYVEAAGGGVPNVTIQLNTHFLSAVQPGEFVALRGEVTRTTGSMVFVRGLISAAGREVVAVDGIWRIFRPRQ